MITQLNVDNLLNQASYRGFDGRSTTVGVGAPRTFLGSIRLEY
jgi:hypothetical protein